MRIEALVESAAQHRIALEINSQTHRLDLSDTHAKLAREHGVKVVISSDAHSPDSFALIDSGVLVARRAWLGPGDVLNTLSIKDLRASLRRHHP